MGTGAGFGGTAAVAGALLCGVAISNRAPPPELISGAHPTKARLPIRAAANPRMGADIFPHHTLTD